MNNILGYLALAVLICSAALTVFHILKLLKMNYSNAKKDQLNQKIEKILLNLDEIIKTSVIATKQSVVDGVKHSGEFLQMEKDEALCQCKERIYHLMNNKEMDVLENFIGNIEEWIQCRIEYYVNRLKKF
ncbi:MAG: hypothetical protein N2645_03465 [Clostridia bacterium]|nr:hypothetical protein [Clostridia bacterium]